MNPFDDESAQFLILRNQEGQYSQWPEFAAIPAGWVAVFGPATHETALAFVEQQWTDLRPLSLTLTYTL